MSILRGYSSAARRWRKAYLALGANVGDKLRNLERACDLLKTHDAIRFLRTSLLYPTKPMYVAEQDWFYNAACEIETTLSPMELLDELQAIENDLGRVKLIDKGPRNIDLDILLFEGETVDNERLTIPHKLMHEREFVLRPLADIIPDSPIPTLDSSRPISSYLADLPASDPPMVPIVPFGEDQFLRPLDPHRSTKVMSILNVTPDSFSDGGLHFSGDTDTSIDDLLRPLETALSSNPQLIDQALLSSILKHPYLSHLHATITNHLTSGSTILDVGGQSTAPNAPSISPSLEFSRIRPALLLAAAVLPRHAAISIDTFRAPIFEASCRLVPHIPLILNDVYAGRADPDILPLASRLHSTVVLMHSRGDAGSMSSPPHTEYPDGLVGTIAEELHGRIRAAEEAGIPAWRIVLDPGIGFAKVGSQNMQLLRDMERLVEHPLLRGKPWLVGSSRKRFVGKILGEDDVARGTGGKGMRGADDRAWGTAATVAAAVQGGADVVRIHDVKPMRDVVAVADAIWRS